MQKYAPRFASNTSPSIPLPQREAEAGVPGKIEKRIETTIQTRLPPVPVRRKRFPARSPQLFLDPSLLAQSYQDSPFLSVSRRKPKFPVSRPVPPGPPAQAALATP